MRHIEVLLSDIRLIFPLYAKVFLVAIHDSRKNTGLITCDNGTAQYKCEI